MVAPLETVHFLPKQHKTTLSGQGTACPLKYAHTLYTICLSGVAVVGLMQIALQLTRMLQWVQISKEELATRMK